MSTPEESGDSNGGPVVPLLEELGERIGRSAGFVANLVRRTGSGLATGIAVESDSGRPAAARAERVVTNLELAVGGLAGAATFGARRLMARAREEYDDIRAEAEARRAGRLDREAPNASE